ncbi:MAG: TVP38/TMEM64 family protein [Corynebacterium sp.]|uniref:TVP38/TMEM64 family protein n=1 Tax=Corynebacterium sp. TaxID=1720 RepID=UPI0026DCB8EF|nr:TVP38/TMEM64 family protein [Corynebacterium sp.]MDO5097724.1 TVP38/TMEM64 family protein [Corynebacterium sp.]
MAQISNFVLNLLKDAYRHVCRWSLPKKTAGVAGIIGMIIITFIIDSPSLHMLSEVSRQTGPWFTVVFFALYVFITQFPVPRTIFTISAGVFFGPVTGILIALCATTLSAALSLTIVRHLLGDWIRPRLTHPTVRKIDHRLQQRGWLAVTSLRMIAGVPFSILNYVAGLTSISLMGFTIATFLGSAPGTIATVVLGDALTTEINGKTIAITVFLACLGIFGLIVDNKLPVKA